MRAVLVCLLIAACASVGSSDRTPAERVAGCWINRDVGASTMRWLPDRNRPGVLLGSHTVYGQTRVSGNTRYTLEQGAEAWGLCQLDPTGAAAKCWQVAQGESGSLEGGRAFIDAHGDTLRIAVVGDGPERVIFYGRRDGCD